MNRIDRLTAILVKLQSKSATSSQELADHFDISLRTVYRDIRALGEAGVPIGLDQGRGYFIVDGYHLPPVMLTKEEAGAILLAGKLMEKMGDKSVSAGFNSALMKINSVLKGEQKDFVENLDKYISVVRPQVPKNENFPDHFLADLKIALVNHRLVEFDYYSQYTDKSNLRQVEPLGLVFYSGHWHLIAFCRLRQDVRDFRTDRIMKLRLLEDHFEPKFNGEYKHLIRSVMHGSEVQEVKIKVSFEVARFISDQKYYYGFVSEERKVEYVEMTYMVGNLNYFARWLIMYGAEADVVEPAQLREEVVKVVNELSVHYATADIGLSP
ncbi:YafY family protein [Reichenbachiella sp. MALMAid0571]|uniref:helix-turn-helix transcriptional regulator n=1 Tax=Reichenbachiella sp. MALMAid0571 TaxID=3143939 RepID=UPI0032DF1FAD